MTWLLMLKPTVPAWCGCRSVSTVTSRTCGELGWGQVAWQPGRPPARVADRTLGAPLNSSTGTGHRNTRSQLAGVRETQEVESGSLYVLVFGVTKMFFHVASAGMDTDIHTYQGKWRRSETACGRWWSPWCLRWRWWVDRPLEGPC